MVQINSDSEESECCIFYNSVIASFDMKNRVTRPPVPSRSSSERHLRLCVLGAKGVGKTAIIVRYLTRRFIGEYRSQIDVSYRHVVSVAKRKAKIEILDFSPKNEEDLIPELEGASSDCFLVVFSIADRVSFLKAVNIVSVVRSFPSSASTPLTLLGNKSDLEHSRQISKEELQNISSLLRCEYSEVSVAENREDIVPVIFRLIKRVLSNTPLSPINNMISVDLKTNANSNSEPCLNNNISLLNQNNFPLRSEIRNIEDENTKSEKPKKTSDKENKGTNNQRCQICCEIHNCRNINSTSDHMKQNSPNIGQELPFKKIRTSKQFPTPLVRTQSLQGKEKKSKHDTKLYKIKKYQKNNSFRHPGGDQKLSTEMKKDSMFSGFLNCSKSPEEPEAMTSYQTISFKDNASKNDLGSRGSLFLRGRSFAQEEATLINNIRSLDGTKANCRSKSPLKSRRTLSSKFRSPEPGSKSESRKTNFDAPKPPPKRSCKTLPDKPWVYLDSSRPPVARPAFGDFSNMRTYSNSSPSPVQRKQKYQLENVPMTPTKIPEKRERKFGVFGRSVLGNVFSKTSLPDLPKATASFYTKIDSIKKTVQKRSI